MNAKTKINFRQNFGLKEFGKKYQLKASQTISTIESKNCNNSNSQFLLTVLSAANACLQKNLRKYGTAHDLFYLKEFQKAFGKSRTSKKILLKDQCFDKSQQMMETQNLDFDKHNRSQPKEQLVEYAEYYKYYIDNPIIFQSLTIFKIMYNLYEKKKYLQYKRLKAVLNITTSQQQQNDQKELNCHDKSYSKSFDSERNQQVQQNTFSSSQNNKNIVDRKGNNNSSNNNNTNKQNQNKTFYIMNFINTTTTTFQQQKALQQMRRQQNEFKNKNNSSSSTSQLLNESDAIRDLNMNLNFMFKDQSNSNRVLQLVSRPWGEQKIVMAFKKKKKKKQYKHLEDSQNQKKSRKNSTKKSSINQYDKNNTSSNCCSLKKFRNSANLKEFSPIKSQSSSLKPQYNANSSMVNVNIPSPFKKKKQLNKNSSIGLITSSSIYHNNKQIIIPFITPIMTTTSTKKQLQKKRLSSCETIIYKPTLLDKEKERVKKKKSSVSTQSLKIYSSLSNSKAIGFLTNNQQQFSKKTKINKQKTSFKNATSLITNLQIHKKSRKTTKANSVEQQQQQKLFRKKKKHGNGVGTCCYSSKNSLDNKNKNKNKQKSTIQENIVCLKKKIQQAKKEMKNEKGFVTSGAASSHLSSSTTTYKKKQKHNNY